MARMLAASQRQAGVGADRTVRRSGDDAERGTSPAGRRHAARRAAQSQLLANILLDDLDKELEKRGHRFCRYADDCNIYVKSEAAGKRVMTSVAEFLEQRLKLKVNRQKSAVGHVSERKFLGHRLLAGPELGVAPQSQESNTWPCSVHP